MDVLTVLKLMVLFGALIGFWFSLMLIFFYEQFKVFDQAVTGRYLVDKKNYQADKSGFLIDQLVFKSHTLFGMGVFFVSCWLIWVFFQSFAAS